MTNSVNFLSLFSIRFNNKSHDLKPPVPLYINNNKNREVSNNSLCHYEKLYSRGFLPNHDCNYQYGYDLFFCSLFCLGGRLKVERTVRWLVAMDCLCSTSRVLVGFHDNSLIGDDDLLVTTTIFTGEEDRMFIISSMQH